MSHVVVFFLADSGWLFHLPAEQPDSFFRNHYLCSRQMWITFHKQMKTILYTVSVTRRIRTAGKLRTEDYRLQNEGCRPSVKCRLQTMVSLFTVSSKWEKWSKCLQSSFYPPPPPPPLAVCSPQVCGLQSIVCVFYWPLYIYLVVSGKRDSLSLILFGDVFLFRERVLLIADAFLSSWRPFWALLTALLETQWIIQMKLKYVMTSQNILVT